MVAALVSVNGLILITWVTADPISVYYRNTTVEVYRLLSSP